MGLSFDEVTISPVKPADWKTTLGFPVLQLRSSWITNLHPWISSQLAPREQIFIEEVCNPSYHSKMFGKPTCLSCSKEELCASALFVSDYFLNDRKTKHVQKRRRQRSLLQKTPTHPSYRQLLSLCCRWVWEVFFVRKHNRHPTQMRVVEDVIQNVFFLTDLGWGRMNQTYITQSKFYDWWKILSHNWLSYNPIEWIWICWTKNIA